MVTKVGYQKGAKEYASEYGISLKELRTPNPGEAIIGEVEMNFDISVRRCLFLVDDNDSETEKFSVSSLDKDSSWINATHIPLELIDQNIINSNGTTITTLEKIEEELPKDSDSDIVFRYEDAFVNTPCGKIKINEIKYEYKYTNEKKIIAIDAQDFVKAILKDALNGEIKLIANKGVR